MIEQIIGDADELVSVVVSVVVGFVVVFVVVVVVVVVVVGKSWPWRQASGNFVLSQKLLVLTVFTLYYCYFLLPGTLSVQRNP